jgi:hypothetical protein
VEWRVPGKDWKLDLEGMKFKENNGEWARK